MLTFYRPAQKTLSQTKNPTRKKPTRKTRTRRKLKQTTTHRVRREMTKTTTSQAEGFEEILLVLRFERVIGGVGDVFQTKLYRDRKILVLDATPKKSSSGIFLSSEEILTLNRGGVCTAPVSTTKTNAESGNKQDDQSGVESRGFPPTWWFDTDAGWRPYDTESNQTLEDAFRSLRALNEDLGTTVHGDEMNNELSKAYSNKKIVLLSSGRYSVNLETMEQTNTESHMLRLVLRK
mmetsp:Transcript_69549/g.141407  ORF Transcript_69549/g.141407 Transcript_69549/m.141407 type:complete len:235 (+) Transcript_69549:266-970(+)